MRFLCSEICDLHPCPDQLAPGPQGVRPPGLVHMGPTVYTEPSGVQLRLRFVLLKLLLCLFLDFTSTLRPGLVGLGDKGMKR